MEVWFKEADVRLDVTFLDKIPLSCPIKLSTHFYKAERSDKDNWQET